MVNTAYHKLTWTPGIALALCLCLETACSLSPKYTRPSVPLAPAYKELGTPDVSSDWKRAQPRDNLPRGKWWEAFDDRELNTLEETLNISNQNIAAAAANVQAAQAMLRQARAQYSPTLTAAPTIGNARTATLFGQPVGATYSTFSVPIEASWEPDLFGRVRNTVGANRLAAQVTAADLENIRLSAQAELTVDYYELRLQDTLKQLLDSTIVAYRDALDLTRDRYKAGLDSDEAVAQAEAQLKATQAQDTNLAVLRAQHEHAIALLTGNSASKFSIPFRTLNTSPPEIPVGIPSELLERRPDIAAAERTMAQANAQIGIAEAAFFPTLALTASIGFQGGSLAGWFQWPSRVWSVGPNVAQAIFDRGLRRATVQQFRASYDQIVANYRQTVLTAFQQVEDNLAAQRILTDVIGQQDSAVEAAARALQDAQVRYNAGLDPYLNVITAQTALLNLQQADINFRAQQLVANIQLIKALGGGWSSSQLPNY